MSAGPAYSRSPASPLAESDLRTLRMNRSIGGSIDRLTRLLGVGPGAGHAQLIAWLCRRDGNVNAVASYDNAVLQYEALDDMVSTEARMLPSLTWPGRVNDLPANAVAANRLGASVENLPLQLVRLRHVTRCQEEPQVLAR